jgi:hypothetical protein
MTRGAVPIGAAGPHEAAASSGGRLAAFRPVSRRR